MDSNQDIERSATVLRPGDRVLLHTRRDVTMREADEIRGRLRQRFPDVEFTLASGIDGVLVAPPVEVRDGG